MQRKTWKWTVPKLANWPWEQTPTVNLHHIKLKRPQKICVMFIRKSKVKTLRGQHLALRTQTIKTPSMVFDINWYPWVHEQGLEDQLWTCIVLVGRQCPKHCVLAIAHMAIPIWKYKSRRPRWTTTKQQHRICVNKPGPSIGSKYRIQVKRPQGEWLKFPTTRNVTPTFCLDHLVHEFFCDSCKNQNFTCFPCEGAMPWPWNWTGLEAQMLRCVTTADTRAVLLGPQKAWMSQVRTWFHVHCWNLYTTDFSFCVLHPCCRLPWHPWVLLQVFRTPPQKDWVATYSFCNPSSAL